nr:F-box protein At5g07610-like [Tanacetum cinerariifolium]
MNRISLGVRFDGCFMHAPLRYQDSKKLILAIRRMAYEELSEFLKNTVGFAHSLYYKVPNVKFETGLVSVSNAKELYYMFDIANMYGWLEMYVDHHDMKLSQYLDAADTTIIDRVVAKWRGPPKTRYYNNFSVDELVNWAKIEIEYDEESIETEEDVSRKGTVENSFTLASTEVVENVKIMQSCNETGIWKLSRDWFNFFSFDHFNSAIYWNGALHWLETEDIQDGYLKHYKLNIENHDHPILATIQIHQGLHRVILALEFTIYEMRKWCSVWSVRYIINTTDVMNLLPEGWSIWSIVWSIVVGEREEGSCLVINLSGKVIEYNLISKTLHKIYDIGSNQLDADELILPFSADHNVYEFIPSFARV